MRSLRRLVLFSVATLSLSMHGEGTSQDRRTGQAETIRVRVRLIPVDVIVTGAHDRSVTDLKQENFQIFDNGRPQQIRHFSIQTVSAASPALNQPAQPHTVQTLDLAPQDARTFMILLGRGRHGLNAVDRLIQFVRAGLLPQDCLAVRAYNRSSEFTTDHAQVVQILERYKKVSEEAIAGSANAARVAIDIFHTNGTAKFAQPPIGSRPGQPPIVPPIWGYTAGVQGIRSISQLKGARSSSIRFYRGSIKPALTRGMCHEEHNR